MPSLLHDSSHFDLFGLYTNAVPDPHPRSSRSRSAPELPSVLENKAGQLADITGILSQNQVNMRAINIAETTDYGVLRLIVDDAAKASSILLEQGSRTFA